MWVGDFGAFEMEQGPPGLKVIANKASGCI
jgi:hypothetical protein